ncbi:response regulator transcription factor [Tepidibacillus fermentans]|uniref:Two-component system OmpR family response regulator n=1 Tax=Tepidibacillus fermentans TaxID=1281767 RepID=A0A4R3KGE0_9BACI|nr:response regulator transcription factor [Tepidibacillus fermentans]TCS82476.1 two-component system OmpR family response regulator [Tepidibacillus fermentans]
MKKKILVVDDESKIRDMVSSYLINEGYVTIEASNGYEVIDQIKQNEIDLILLDIMMPGIDGYQTLREVRQMNKKIPVILLTAKSDEVDKLLGLEMGADDYITKPFSLRELLARMKAVLRRTSSDGETLDEEMIIRGDISINLSKYEVYVSGRKVGLTPTEFKILVALAQKPGRVFSRLQLMNIAMGEAYANYERSIDTHVSNLRKKVEEDPANPKYIHTVYGIGYRFGGEV